MPNHKFEREHQHKAAAQERQALSFDEGVALQIESSEPAPTASSEIARIYSQLRKLVGRSRREPELRGEIDHLTKRLRELQELDADSLERRFEKRLRLKPGTGWMHLSRIKERLGDA